jgi:subtilase family serine protease
MKKLVSPLYALSLCVAGSMSAGCGGAGPQIGNPWLAKQGGVRSRLFAPACNDRRIGRVRCGVVIQGIRSRLDEPSGWSPADLQSAYKLPAKKKGAGQIVALVDPYDNSDVASDLAEYRSTFKLPAANFAKYNQEGQQSNYPPSCENYGWCVQSDSDVDMVSASCPNCTIYLVEANSDAWSDIETAEAEAVKLGAHIVSNSYAGESGADKSYFDTPGVEYLASPESEIGVSEPSNFDSVVAVGATVLARAPGKRGWTEMVWDLGNDGGCSKHARRPPWQHDQYCKHRLANDVAANATNVAVYSSTYGGWVNVDGSGVPTPLLAGVFGLVGNTTKQSGGRTFWESSHQKYLFRVTEGSGECAYVDYPEYNSCTGWGTPDGIDAF